MGEKGILPGLDEKPRPPDSLIAKPLRKEKEKVRKGIIEEDIFPVPYEKHSPRDFGTAEKGMPGDGSTGSFIAELFIGRGVEEEISEPFLPGEGEDIAAILPQEEEVRSRLLNYRST